MQGNNNRRRQRRLVIAWAGSIALGLGLAMLLRNGPGLPASVSVPAGLLVVAAITAMQIYYWRTLDELARQIQTHAFFWSGLTTWGLLALLFVIAPLFPADAASLAQIGTAGGALLVVLAHALLYLALWAWGWLKQR
jgi:hypothetical protein